jgi:pSer/pThr/pTyr-binding forkhead associated (FHA) protein
LALIWVHPRTAFTLLDGGEIVLGRSETSRTLLPGKEISREHARVERRDGFWLIHDLESKNGTVVNGRRSKTSALSEQDVVRLGEWIAVLGRVTREQLELHEVMVEQ